ncbi:MAG: flagellar biosynthesis anti-sigma factor FlgM [Desulfobacterales bacterium]|jgi:flagellar biosynthesis anti-sigma factor FlgM
MKPVDGESDKKVVRLQTRRRKPHGKNGPDDSENRSGDIRLIRKAMARLRAIPDCNEKKIMEIRRRIEAGQYHIDAEAIAEKLLREHLDSES